MEIKIEVPFSPRLLSAFADAPKGVRVRVLQGLLHRDFGHVDTTALIIQFGTGVAGNLVAAWIFDKFKERRPKKTSINDVEIPWDKAELTRIIKEELEKPAQRDPGTEEKPPQEQSGPS